MREDAPDWTRPRAHSSLGPEPGEEWAEAEEYYDADQDAEPEVGEDQYAERVRRHADEPQRPEGAPPLQSIALIQSNRARLAKVMQGLADLDEVTTKLGEAPEGSTRAQALMVEALVAMENLVALLVPPRYARAAARWAKQAEPEALSELVEWWMQVSEPGEAEPSPPSRTRGTARRSRPRSRGTRPAYPW